MKKVSYLLTTLAVIFIMFGCQKEEAFISDPSLKSVVPIPLPFPVPVVTASVSGNSVTVSWNSVDQYATNYEAVFTGDYPIVPEPSTTALSIVRTGLQNGNYFVKVKTLGSALYSYMLESPYCVDVPFTINVIVPPTDPPVQEVLCSYSQGFYFGNKKTWAFPTVTVGGYVYSEAEARAIWNTKNGKGGIADSKKAFCQIVAIKLSGTTVPEVLNLVATAEAWLSTVGKLSPSNLPSGNKTVANAAGDIAEFIDDNHCD